MYEEEYIKMFMKDDFLKLLIIEVKKNSLPDTYKLIVEKLEKLDSIAIITDDSSTACTPNK